MRDLKSIQYNFTEIQYIYLIQIWFNWRLFFDTMSVCDYEDSVIIRAYRHPLPILKIQDNDVCGHHSVVKVPDLRRHHNFWTVVTVRFVFIY